MRLLIPSPLFVAVALGAVAALELTRQTLPEFEPAARSETAPRPLSPEGPATSSADPDLPPLSDAHHAALAAHPLFSETRAPAIYQEPVMPDPIPNPEPIIEDIAPDPFVPEVLDVEPTPPPEPLELRYLGYINSDIDSTNGARALVADTQSGEERWLGVGDALNNWRVATISQSQVTFTQDGFEFSVKMNR